MPIHGFEGGEMTIVPERIPSVRLVPDNTEVLQDLGPLANLVGAWEGRGFNLIARPDFHDQANLYLQLNQTHENFRVSAIGSAIPNRGFGQDDINLFGVSYLQKIHDASTGGALHFEPGLWITQPGTAFPPENPAAPASLVHRMGTIPHGNALLASGTAQPVNGTPTLPNGNVVYNGSIFPSFNSTPFGAGGGVINAAGSSDQGTAAANPGVIAPFNEYNIADPEGPGNPRTPFGTNPPEPPLPLAIDGVKMQDIVNDPITLLQAQIRQQIADGEEFESVALNIASQATVTFSTQPNSKLGGPTTTVTVVGGDGGVENILFLDGEGSGKTLEPNAHTALVYATFWIETVHPRHHAPYMQLQYAQMTVLDFPIFTLRHPAGGGQGPIVDLGWPHISVATLRKSFNA
jgi:hypothetical protein